jgi:DNA primase large subunit
MAGYREQAMDTIAYAKYPFTQEASCYVKDRQYSIEDVIVKPAYEQVRTRAKRRVLDTIKGDAHPGDRLSDPERELLSYPVARIIVASTGDQYLIKRFALWESHAYSCCPKARPGSLPWEAISASTPG